MKGTQGYTKYVKDERYPVSKERMLREAGRRAHTSTTSLTRILIHVTRECESALHTPAGSRVGYGEGTR